MPIKAILFDFDGTIADTQEAFLAIVNQLAVEFGYPPVDREEVERLRTLSSVEVIEYAQISPLKLPFILRRLKKELGKTISTLKPYSAIREALSFLKDKGYILGIVTSNHRDNVMVFLRHNDLARFFDFVYAGTTLFGKNRIINRVLKEHQWTANEVIYVGDETRDISAAKKSRLTMISVGWGFSSPSILQTYQPDFLVHHPQELVEAIATVDQNLSPR